MKSSKTTWIVAGVVAVALVAGLAIVGWFTLREDESRTTGSCGTATYELTVESDDDNLEVSFELLSSAPGEEWNVVVEQDGTVLLEGTRATDEDAELGIDAPARGDGGDFTVTATPADGEPCTAELSHG